LCAGGYCVEITERTHADMMKIVLKSLVVVSFLALSLLVSTAQAACEVDDFGNEINCAVRTEARVVRMEVVSRDKYWENHLDTIEQALIAPS